MSDVRTEQLHLNDMPADELQTLAGQLMVATPTSPVRNDLVTAVSRQLQVINRLERQALLDIVIWARRPVARSADKRELVREISQIRFSRYDGLSVAGLIALAKLRNLAVPDAVTDRQIQAMLYRDDGIGGWFARKRRRLMAGLVGKLLDADTHAGEYQFLPDEQTNGSLKRQIEQQGVVGGIASKLKGAADDYINTKLDEIEQRIDRKLDEIDRRLAEWRDQEIANRLKIVKVTLIGTVIVAVVSVIYNYFTYNR